MDQIKAGKVGARGAVTWRREFSYKDTFTAYFNNKLTVFMMMTERKVSSRDRERAREAVFFFTDFYRHWLTPGQQKDFGVRLNWLIHFFTHYPHVLSEEKEKAMKVMRGLVPVFGMPDAGSGDLHAQAEVNHVGFAA